MYLGSTAVTSASYILDIPYHGQSISKDFQPRSSGKVPVGGRRTGPSNVAKTFAKIVIGVTIINNESHQWDSINQPVITG